MGLFFMTKNETLGDWILQVTKKDILLSEQIFLRHPFLYHFQYPNKDIFL